MFMRDNYHIIQKNGPGRVVQTLETEARGVSSGPVWLHSETLSLKSREREGRRQNTQILHHMDKP